MSGKTDRNTRIAIVSLGCAKSRVDSEILLGQVRSWGYQPAGDPGDADIVLVNTCTFMQQATEESVNVILDLGNLRKKGKIKRLIVTGCLPQRYPEELADALPEVDAFVGTGEFDRLSEVLSGSAGRIVVGTPGSWIPEDTHLREGFGSSAYLKISDGCSRKCSFCIIPSIKGPGTSKPIDVLYNEAIRLVEHGVVEICLVAQDTATYGMDIGLKDGLARLVEKIRTISGLKWLRIMYYYPGRMSGRLLGVFAEGDPLLPYLDIPVQHANDRVLKKMRRGYGQSLLRSIVEKLRIGVPDIILRTTVIVGHPGEDEVAFEELMDFLKWAGFERLGVFRFSAEQGTEAAGWKAPSGRESYNRWRKVNALSRRLQRKANAHLRGRILEMLVEGPDPDAPYLMQARHRLQAPEVDGIVHLADAAHLKAGEITMARVERSTDDDLIARVWSERA